MRQRLIFGNVRTLMKSSFNGFLVLAFIITSACVTPSEAFRGSKARDPEKIISHLTRELGLSDTQVTQIRPIIENQAEQRKLIFEKYASQGRSGRKAMRGEMDALREKTDSQLASVLADEQMAKHRELHDQRRQNRGQRGKERRF